MLPAIAYLDFATRFYGQVRFDLASSGIAAIAAEFLGSAAPVYDLSARDRYRDALSARYGVSPTEIVPALGGSGALFMAAATLLEPGSRVLVESPCYEPLWRAADALGAGIDRFERRFEDGFAVDLERVIENLRPETRAVAITNPHNPSGALIDDAALAELARRLATRDIFLLVDEVYLELFLPRKSARTLAGNIVTCSSATKCWGVPWARAGWLFLPDRLATAAARVERYVAGMAPPVCWAWGEAAVNSADRLLERAHELQRDKRQLVSQFVADSSEVLAWIEPPAAAVFGWLRDRRGRDLFPIIERGIREHGVLVAPGSFFGDASAFRLGWTGSLETLERGLPVLARVLGSGGAS